MIEDIRRIPGATIRDNARIIDPATPEAAAAVLGMCADNKWSARPIGAGTLIVGPTPNDVIALSTSAFTATADYKPEDLTITAGAGVRIDELQQLLARNGQWLALDPPAGAAATIGGLVATGASGPMRARYGTPRDHVLGLQIVTGAGRILDFGGQVVKNVAGYDMVRPIVGSRGSLGLITRVSLRLRPLPTGDITIELEIPDNSAFDIALSIHDAWPVAALEVLGETTGWRILVRLQGQPDEVAEGKARIHGVLPTSAKPTNGSESEAWSRLSAAEAAAPASIRLAALPSRSADVAKIAKRCSDLVFGDSGHIALHATAGVFRIWGTPASPEKDALDEAAAAMARIDGTVRASGLDWRQPFAGRTRQINDAIKALFDPAGILPRYWA